MIQNGFQNRFVIMFTLQISLVSVFLIAATNASFSCRRHWSTHSFASFQNTASMPSSNDSRCSSVRSAHKSPPIAGISKLLVVCRSRLPLLSIPTAILAHWIMRAYISGSSRPGPRQWGASTGHSGAYCQRSPQIDKGNPARTSSAMNGPRSGNQVRRSRLPLPIFADPRP